MVEDQAKGREVVQGEDEFSCKVILEHYIH